MNALQYQGKTKSNLDDTFCKNYFFIMGARWFRFLNSHLGDDKVDLVGEQTEQTNGIAIDLDAIPNAILEIDRRVAGKLRANKILYLFCCQKGWKAYLIPNALLLHALVLLSLVNGVGWIGRFWKRRVGDVSPVLPTVGVSILGGHRVRRQGTTGHHLNKNSK